MKLQRITSSCSAPPIRPVPLGLSTSAAYRYLLRYRYPVWMIREYWMPQGSIALTCHPLRAGSFIHKCLLNIYFMPDIMLGGSGDTKKKKGKRSPAFRELSSLTSKQELFTVQCDNPVYTGAV